MGFWGSSIFGGIWQSFGGLVGFFGVRRGFGDPEYILGGGLAEFWGSGRDFGGLVDFWGPGFFGVWLGFMGYSVFLGGLVFFGGSSRVFWGLMGVLWCLDLLGGCVHFWGGSGRVFGVWQGFLGSGGFFGGPVGIFWV